METPAALYTCSNFTASESLSITGHVLSRIYVHLTESQTEGQGDDSCWAGQTPGTDNETKEGVLPVI